MVNLASFWKTEACGQTVLPDRSVLIGQKMVENAKILKLILINWLILIFLPGILQTCLQRHSFCFVDYESSYKRSKQFFNIEARAEPKVPLASARQVAILILTQVAVLAPPLRSKHGKRQTMEQKGVDFKQSSALHSRFSRTFKSQDLYQVSQQVLDRNLAKNIKTRKSEKNCESLFTF